MCPKSKELAQRSNHARTLKSKDGLRTKQNKIIICRTNNMWGLKLYLGWVLRYE
ncbi:hypothetical protein C5S39_06270 [Candidatus Methanophagaceae archaeon]|nr:hypothetical protein C5S39_06270 [Methanophagales archaeon]